MTVRNAWPEHAPDGHYEQMHKVKLLLRAFVMVLAACAFVGCAGQQEEKEQDAKEEGELKENKQGEKTAQAQRFEDLAVGETATFQNGLELTLTDAGVVTTPTTPPATDPRGNPKPNDPNRVLQNMMPGGTELLAFRFTASHNGPAGATPAKIASALACHDKNGNTIPPVAAHNELRRAIRAEAGLPELPRQAAPLQQFSGQPLEVGQTRDALLVCEMPLEGGDVEAGVNVATPIGNEGPGAWWTVDPADLEAMPPDKI